MILVILLVNLYIWHLISHKLQAKYITNQKQNIRVIRSPGYILAMQFYTYDSQFIYNFLLILYCFETTVINKQFNISLILLATCKVPKFF